MTTSVQRPTWNQILVCGFIAGGVWTLLSFLVVTLVGGDFFEALPRLQQDSSAPHSGLLLLISNFIAAIWAMWFYLALHERFQPAVKRAVIVGVAWWTLQSMQSLKWIVVVGTTLSSVVPLVIATLPAMIVSVAAGAWAYHFDVRRQNSAPRVRKRPTE